jgi:hypothetical protein
MDMANSSGKMGASTGAITGEEFARGMESSLMRKTKAYTEVFGGEECWKARESWWSREELSTGWFGAIVASLPSDESIIFSCLFYISIFKLTILR